MRFDDLIVVSIYRRDNPGFYRICVASIGSPAEEKLPSPCICLFSSAREPQKTPSKSSCITGQERIHALF